MPTKRLSLLLSIPLLLIVALGLWLGFHAGDPVPRSKDEDWSGNTPNSVADGPVIPKGSTKSNEDVGQSTKFNLPTAPNIIPPEPGEVMPQAVTPSGPELVHEWLSSSTDIPTIANTMLKGFPSLEAKDHLHAVGNLVALVSDDRFEGLKWLLLDPKTSLEAKEFLFRDALSRGDLVKLPLLLTVMQQRDHPCAGEAHDVLKQQLGTDFGVNYVQWQARIAEVLRAQQ